MIGIGDNFKISDTKPESRVVVLDLSKDLSEVMFQFRCTCHPHWFGYIATLPMDRFLSQVTLVEKTL